MENNSEAIRANFENFEKKAEALNKALDKLTPTQKLKVREKPLRSAIANSLRQLNVRPSETAKARKERHIKSAEAALEKLEAQYKENNKYYRGQIVTKHKRLYPEVSGEDIKRLQERIENSKLHLAKMKGEDASFKEKRKLEKAEKERKERLDYAKAIEKQQEKHHIKGM